MSSVGTHRVQTEGTAPSSLSAHHSHPSFPCLPLERFLRSTGVHELAFCFWRNSVRCCSLSASSLARQRHSAAQPYSEARVWSRRGRRCAGMACSRRARCFVARRGRPPRPLRSCALTSFACACVPTPLRPRSHQPADRTSRRAGSRATCHACRRVRARVSCRLWPRARARFALCRAVACLRKLYKALPQQASGE